ncbi:hypothetical protein EV11_0341 [Prochlorococcus sp. SS52]|nr:hypothetical protein EV04_1527 [Prochlorococcus marinus str. LG]KGG18596.1 hypothetical protein EV08_1844 [Prochlorococcus marinus str. SS2]KGG22869.1 hypothetical protein EV09_1611 [Prochlorococcus marinus str. SS35]KGG32745.1 hypothetical protein EV10_1062 [Prochlorococcus marinus str. SS51]KGG37073.1 hypothetical protein EV11_0341 [Prochlorococcus sp. SS52]
MICFSGFEKACQMPETKKTKLIVPRAHKILRSLILKSD